MDEEWKSKKVNKRRRGEAATRLNLQREDLKFCKKGTKRDEIK